MPIRAVPLLLTSFDLRSVPASRSHSSVPTIAAVHVLSGASVSSIATQNSPPLFSGFSLLSASLSLPIRLFPVARDRRVELCFNTHSKESEIIGAGREQHVAAVNQIDSSMGKTMSKARKVYWESKFLRIDDLPF
jgi:hypothetical protein